MFEPLAERMRPTTLEEYIGQQEAVGSKSLLSKSITTDTVPSLILWGPPGTGKTTLAHIIGKQTKADVVKLSAVSSGIKELRDVVERAEQNNRMLRKTILFIDEIHRWNTAQQDALLPYVERGTIVLIGATTENPSFAVRGALLSRCRVIVLKELTPDDLKSIINRALKDKEKGLGHNKVSIDEEALTLLSHMANGDARRALTTLEVATTLSKKITATIIKQAVQKNHIRYDKDGEEHYNVISALHKSMRGSDSNAALYYLARMLEGGEDPLYIARRIIRFASEDIGTANSQALVQAVAAYQACQFIGMPECSVNLAQAVVYMAQSKKSNALYTGYNAAKKDVETRGNLPVPLHIRNAPTKLMKELNYGKDYIYNPDTDYTVTQQYLPDALSDRAYLP